MQRLMNFKATGNRFSGPIPDDLYTLNNLQVRHGKDARVSMPTIAALNC